MEITQVQLNNAQSLPGPRRLDYLDTAPKSMSTILLSRGEVGRKRRWRERGGETGEKRERAKMDKEEVMEEIYSFDII